MLMLPDVSARFSSAVPAWSIIALERARRGRPDSKWARFERIAGAIMAPFSIGFACVLLASISVWSWPLGIAVATMGSVAATLVRRSSFGRSWRERGEIAARDCAAAQLKRELGGRLAPDQREELARLEILVEHVRAQPGPFGSTAGSLVSRLDGLIVLFVDLALELERSIAAFAATADDVPPSGELATLDPSRARYVRIAQLRAQAREMCRRRITRLRADLGGVGQLVRLVHEQTLAAGLSSDEVARQLGEILDEAELARQAREELDGIVPDREALALATEPRALPVAS
ncbi:MAG TPA: hypothetical protein VG755_01040 [Nannocystaceae bacterium]|nr:hypothetical protein [Nannocystaceae bacterium]